MVVVVVVVGSGLRELIRTDSEVLSEMVGKWV